MIQQHEYPGDTTLCKHCGAPQGTEATCIKRETATNQQRPFVSAMNDLDSIHARIKELRDEHNKALAASPETK